jgi:hypothetical protein
MVRQNAPHIYFIAGVSGVVASTVMACRATLRAQPVLEVTKKELIELRETKALATGESQYPDKDYQRHLAHVYINGGMKLMKLYAPSVLVSAASIGLLTTSHVTMTKRNNALGATVVALSKAYEEYRDRVREEVGEERELELYHGIKDVEIKTKDGKAVIKVVDPNNTSIYARFFDEGSKNWVKNAEYNRMFLNGIQAYMNDLLHARGHLFLNEVYDALDIPRSDAGQHVGWTMYGDGDLFVDFGIIEVYNANFVNGSEPRILLDFNVDGPIRLHPRRDR